MKRWWAIAGFTLLTACGQTGALYLPETSAESPVEIRPMSPATGSDEAPAPAPGDSSAPPTAPGGAAAPSPSPVPAAPADTQAPSDQDRTQGVPPARTPAR